MTDQKGFALLQDIANDVLDNQWVQFVFLGKFHQLGQTRHGKKSMVYLPKDLEPQVSQAIEHFQQALALLEEDAALLQDLQQRITERLRELTESGDLEGAKPLAEYRKRLLPIEEKVAKKGATDDEEEDLNAPW